MIYLIQNQLSGLYFKAWDAWVAFPEDARRFSSMAEATTFRRDGYLADTRILEHESSERQMKAPTQ